MFAGERANWMSTKETFPGHDGLQDIDDMHACGNKYLHHEILFQCFSHSYPLEVISGALLFIASFARRLMRIYNF